MSHLKARNDLKKTIFHLHPFIIQNVKISVAISLLQFYFDRKLS